DAAALPADCERRHRVRDLGIERAVADSGVIRGTEHERLEPGTEIAVRRAHLETQVLEDRNFVRGIAVKRAGREPAVVVEHPDGGPRRAEEGSRQLGDASERLVQARRGSELAAELEQGGGAL